VGGEILDFGCRLQCSEPKGVGEGCCDQENASAASARVAEAQASMNCSPELLAAAGIALHRDPNRPRSNTSE
jgi:hypothetical protein